MAASMTRASRASAGAGGDAASASEGGLNIDGESIQREGVQGEILHGGDLGAARRLFPGAPEPFLDLSTGINPRSWQPPPIGHEWLTRLPEPGAVARLAAAAARTYGAPSPACVTAAPGTQILLAPLARLVPAGKAAVLGPATYGEHRRAATLAGHDVAEVSRLEELAGADLAVVVNPNNPDGRVVSRRELLVIKAARRGGLLVVDEAFMDVGPDGGSVCGEVMDGGLVVLRSFGKFFGLAGVRLGFAVAAPALAARLRATLGPWAVSGPALAIGRQALADTAWIAATRARLGHEASRLDGVLAGAGLEIAGGTPLFRLVRTPRARGLFQDLGRAGILVRRFETRPDWLRFGLPGNDAAWQRLRAALRPR